MSCKGRTGIREGNDMEMNAFGEGIGIVKHVGRSVYLAARAPALSRCVS